MSTPLILIGELPDPRFERLTIQRPGRATMTFLLESPVRNPPVTPQIPSNSGTPLSDWKLVAQEADWLNGYYLCRWVYECGMTMPKAPDSPEDESDTSVIYSMCASVQQEPLVSHPNFPAIKAKYNGYFQNGQILFPPQDPTGQSKRTGYDVSGNYYGAINPLYNVDSFLSPRVLFRRRSMAPGNSLPIDLLNPLGLVDQPPGNFPFFQNNPNYATAADWIKSDTPIEQHGNDIEIDEEWRQGGIGGWRRLLYDPSYNP